MVCAASSEQNLMQKNAPARADVTAWQQRWQRGKAALASVVLVMLINPVLPAVAQTVSAGTDKLLARLCTSRCEQKQENIAVFRSSGNAVAAWVEGSSTIVTARYTASTNSWGPTSRFYNEIGTEPKIAFDASANGLMVWTRYSSTGESLLRFSHHTSGIGWSTPSTALYGGEAYSGLQLAMSSGGDAVLTFRGTSGRAYRIQYDRTSRSWYNYTEIAADSRQSTMDSRGNILAAQVFRDPNNGETLSMDLYYFRKDWGYWNYIGTPEFHSPSFDSNGVPDATVTIPSISLALAPNGTTGAVLWERSTRLRSGAVSRTMRSAQFFQNELGYAMRGVPSVSSGRVREITLATDGNGVVYAVWNQFIGSYAKTVAARYRPGTSSWTTPMIIQAGNFHSRDPDLRIDASNNVFAVWAQRSDSGTASSTAAVHRITVNRFRASTGSWSTPLRIQDASRNGYKGFLGVDNNGRAVVLWNQDSGIFVNGVNTKELRADRLLPQ